VLLEGSRRRAEEGECIWVPGGSQSTISKATVFGPSSVLSLQLLGPKASNLYSLSVLLQSNVPGESIIATSPSAKYGRLLAAAS
jgi:hypothetical protein